MWYMLYRLELLAVQYKGQIHLLSFVSHMNRGFAVLATPVTFRGRASLSVVLMGQPGNA